MGYIATLTVNNDFLHQLKDVPDLGSRIRDAVSMLSISQPQEVRGAHITAIETHHADYAQAVLIGGGKEGQLINGVSINYLQEEPELELLKQLARKHGFDLHKRRGK